MMNVLRNGCLGQVLQSLKYCKCLVLLYKQFSRLILFLILFPLIGKSQCESRYLDRVFSEEQILFVEDGLYGEKTYQNSLGQSILQAYDLYMPNPEIDPILERPLLILAHGGAFVNGNKQKANIVRVAKNFARRGFVVASIDYRLINANELWNVENIGSSLEERGGVFMPILIESVCDMRTAIRYFLNETITNNTNIYGIDPEQVIVGGSSAGAVIALHTAYVTDSTGISDYSIVDLYAYTEEYRDCFFEMPNEDLPIKAVLNLTGALATVDFIQEGEAALISIHEELDPVVPCEADTVSLAGIKIADMDGTCVLDERATSSNIPSFFTLLEDAFGHVNYLNTNTKTQLYCDWASSHLVNFIEREYFIIDAPNADFSIASDTLCGSFQDTIVNYWITGTAFFNDVNPSLFPNPVNDWVFVKNNQAISAKIKFYQINGQYLGSYCFEAQTLFKIPMSDIPQGYILMEIDFGSQKICKRLLVLH